MKSIGTNKLLAIKEQAEIFEVLNKARENGSTVFLWILVNGNKETVSLKFRLIRKIKNEIEFVPVGCVEKTKRLLTFSEKINIYLPNEAVIFQTQLKGVSSDNIIRAAIPDMVAQVDRRKSLRLVVPETMDVKVRFYKMVTSPGRVSGTQAFLKSCFDVSAGGLSFIVSKMEQKFFVKGDSINPLVLEFENEKFELGGKIVNLIPVDPSARNNLMYGGFRVCVEFDKLVAERRENLELFVFRHVDLD